MPLKPFPTVNVDLLVWGPLVVCVCEGKQIYIKSNTVIDKTDYKREPADAITKV
jgi:nucleoside diphosphate kinase